MPRRGGLLAAALVLCFVQAASAAQYILRTASGANLSPILSSYGLVLVKSITDDGRTVFLVSDGTGPVSSSLVSQVSADPSVVSFEPDQEIQSSDTPPAAQPVANPAALAAAIQDHAVVQYYGAPVRESYVLQPALSLIHDPQVLSSYATGAGIVAVIDTGVDPNHPALRGVLVPGYDFTRDQPGFASELADLNQSTVAILDQSTVAILDKNFGLVLNQSTVAILDQSTVAILDGSKLPSDFGHGTMVAGLIHLVAPTAQIMPLKAFAADGSADLSNIVRAIYYAVDHGASVINMSFSSPVLSPSLSDAIAYAASHRVMCFASAGNGGSRVVVYPAAIQGVIGVGSTSLLDKRSPFSNYDTASVRMAAPGEALITTYPGNNYAGVWGTSFSTALSSGAAALLLQVKPRIYGGLSDALEHGHPLDIGMGDARLDVLSSVLYCLLPHD
ncbi:MAG: S8 family serine peptidase [Acidobacteria bacterium]|nr:S8 family serine peptidase [Acidobacteriota bacterium]